MYFSIHTSGRGRTNNVSKNKWRPDHKKKKMELSGGNKTRRLLEEAPTSAPGSSRSARAPGFGRWAARVSGCWSSQYRSPAFGLYHLGPICAFPTHRDSRRMHQRPAMMYSNRDTAAHPSRCWFCGWRPLCRSAGLRHPARPQPGASDTSPHRQAASPPRSASSSKRCGPINPHAGTIHARSGGRSSSNGVRRTRCAGRVGDDANYKISHKPPGARCAVLHSSLLERAIACEWQALFLPRERRRTRCRRTAIWL